MTIAYCFSCGAEKVSPIAVCGSCQATPKTENELVLALILSDEISTPAQLVHFAHEIRSHLHLSAPDSLTAKARVAAGDPKYQRILAGSRPANSASSAVPRQVSTPLASPKGNLIRKEPKPSPAPGLIGQAKTWEQQVQHQLSRGNPMILGLAAWSWCRLARSA